MLGALLGGWLKVLPGWLKLFVFGAGVELGVSRLLLLEGVAVELISLDELPAVLLLEAELPILLPDEVDELLLGNAGVVLELEVAAFVSEDIR